MSIQPANQSTKGPILVDITDATLDRAAHKQVISAAVSILRKFNLEKAGHVSIAGNRYSFLVDVRTGLNDQRANVTSGAVLYLKRTIPAESKGEPAVLEQHQIEVLDLDHPDASSRFAFSHVVKHFKIPSDVSNLRRNKKGHFPNRDDIPLDSNDIAKLKLPVPDFQSFKEASDVLKLMKEIDGRAEQPPLQEVIITKDADPDKLKRFREYPISPNMSDGFRGEVEFNNRKFKFKLRMFKDGLQNIIPVVEVSSVDPDGRGIHHDFMLILSSDGKVNEIHLSSSHLKTVKNTNPVRPFHYKKLQYDHERNLSEPLKPLTEDEKYHFIEKICAQVDETLAKKNAK